MSEDIPYATPYPWDNPSMEESLMSSNDNLRGKEPTFVGSGFASLRKNAFGPNSTMGTEAKNMLMTMLQRYNVKIAASAAAATTTENNNIAEFGSNNNNNNTTQADKLYGGTSTALCLTTATTSSNNKKKKMANMPGTMSDDAVVIGLARKGNLSIFASILHLIENAKQAPVTNKHIVRHCCLTLRPQDIPGSLDAKEMVLASLQFLCSTFEPSSNNSDDDVDEQPQLLLNLPLLKSVQEVADLEKRSYQKLGEWKLSEIHDQLLRMETIFLESSPTTSSSSNLLWIRREAFCPRLSQKDETSFCLKGTIPASASAKKAVTGTRKRKATPSSSTTTVAATNNINNNDLHAADTSSGGPVVEATVIADGDSPDHDGIM